MTRKSGFVAIIGRPNAGKSTLLNTILKTTLSIVTPKAQTTRERVLGILTEKQGQIVFVDTPGIHRAKEGGINEYMMNEAREALQGPDVIWYLIDPNSALKHEGAVLELLDSIKARNVIAIINKKDLFKKMPRLARNAQELETQIRGECERRGVGLLGVETLSAKDSKSAEMLLEKTWPLLKEGPLYYSDEEQLSDRPTRYFVAEKIREQLLLNLGEELPYSCAVEIEKFDEASKPARGFIRIEAVIHVERESQKGMVIGKGARKIKEIGIQARKEIEGFLGQKVFLGLKVKVLKDWSRDRKALERMGYHLP